MMSIAVFVHVILCREDGSPTGRFFVAITISYHGTSVSVLFCILNALGSRPLFRAGVGV